MKRARGRTQAELGDVTSSECFYELRRRWNGITEEEEAGYTSCFQEKAWVGKALPEQPAHKRSVTAERLPPRPVGSNWLRCWTGAVGRARVRNAYAPCGLREDLNFAENHSA